MPKSVSLKKLEEILVQLEPESLDSLITRVKEQIDKRLKQKKDYRKPIGVQPEPRSEISDETIINVKHPYITVQKEVCGGRPTIAGTRITVSAIIQYYKQGKDIDEILELLPHLHPAQLHDAFSYYYEHQEEIEREIFLDNDEAYWQKKYPPGKGTLIGTQSNGSD